MNTSPLSAKAGKRTFDAVSKVEENNTGDTIKKKEGKAEAAGSPPKMLELATPPIRSC